MINICKKTAVWSVAVLLAAALVPAQSAAQTHKNVSWRKVLQAENRRVDNQGAASVLGASVGASVKRIQTQVQAKQKMNKYLAQMPKELVKKSRQNHNRAEQILSKNPLFQGYVLAAPVPTDFYKMGDVAFRHFLAFCNGQVNPVHARQYKQGIFLALQAPNATDYTYLLIDPKNKIVTLVYNDPADLDQHFLSGKWYELNVR